MDWERWTYLLAALPLLIVTVPSYGAQIGTTCAPPCINPHTYCPVDGTEPLNADDDDGDQPLYGPTQCECNSGYEPFRPVEPPPTPAPLECLVACNEDQVRPLGSREPCTDCVGDDSKPNPPKTECLFRTCWDPLFYSGFANCDERKQRMPPATNGCGGDDSDCFLNIDHAGLIADFEPACDNHDRCYTTCGSSRSACDDAFGHDMYRICRDTFPWWMVHLRIICFADAELMELAVESCGSGPYKDAQVAFCRCCNWVEESEL